MKYTRLRGVVINDELRHRRFVYVRPHITRQFSQPMMKWLWRCETANAAGVGDSPRKAYKAWMNIVCRDFRG